MQRVTWKRPGFSLLETITALGVGSLILLLVFQGISLGNRSTEVLFREVQVSLDEAYSLEYIVEEIRMAEKVVQFSSGRKFFAYSDGKDDRNFERLHLYTYEKVGSVLKRYGGTYSITPNFYHHVPTTLAGTNILNREVEDFSLEHEDSFFRIYLKIRGGKGCERIVARRCPIEP